MCAIIVQQLCHKHHKQLLQATRGQSQARWTVSFQYLQTRLRAAADAGDSPNSSNGEESITLLLRRKPAKGPLPFRLPSKSKAPLLLAMSLTRGDLAPESLLPTRLGADSGIFRGMSILPPRRGRGLRLELVPLRGVVAAGVANSPALIRW